MKTLLPVMPAKAGIHDFTIHEKASIAFPKWCQHRHCETRSDDAIHLSLRRAKNGLLRCARNDGSLEARDLSKTTVSVSDFTIVTKGKTMQSNELPSNDTIARALLRHLHLRAKSVRPQEIYGPLADSLKLTSYQLSLKRGTTNESLWNNRVQAAREHLATKGFLERARRGYWSLTPAGHVEAIKQENLEVRFREVDEKLGLNWPE